MKVCVVGTFSNKHDEGFKNIAMDIVQGLSTNHDVLVFDIKNLFSISYWFNFIRFRPQIVHYITAPTLGSLLCLKIVKVIFRFHIKTVVSAVHPNGYNVVKHSWSRYIIPLVKPDLILTQSKRLQKCFNRLNVNSILFPNGVDVDKFSPVSSEKKKDLREKYGLDPHKYVLLHVGHLKVDRGISILPKIQQMCENCQVLVVGSECFSKDGDLCKRLEGSGVMVWNQYFENIQEIYQLSDCYFFPKGTTIFMPLSVMEAMACGLPIVTYPFDGLTSFFENMRGLNYYMDNDEIVQYLNGFMHSNNQYPARAEVSQFSKKYVTQELEGIYYQLSEVTKYEAR
jgi:glycosyltransferase involved in cell wall biosynthesis